MANTGSATRGADIRALEAAADQENDHPANQPSEFSDTLTSNNVQQWNDDNASERGDETDSLPSPILSTDTLDSKINKWKLWIQHYWDVNDCRDLIPKKNVPKSYRWYGHARPPIRKLPRHAER
jgi:hypothetical protein